MPRQHPGPKVIDGVLQYESPSGLKKHAACNRAWYYRYVLRLKEPRSKAAEAGVEIHDQIERWYNTGSDTLNTAARRLRPWMPPRSGHIVTEHNTRDFCFVPGVKVVAFIDILSNLGTYLDRDGVEQQDPPGTIEVLDWKSTSNMRYAVPGPQLPETIQMIVYGMYALAKLGGDHIRLSHATTNRNKNEAKKSTFLASSKKIIHQWNTIVLPEVKRVQITAGMSDVDRVPGNEKACSNYGGCARQGICNIAKQKSLAQIFGDRGAMALIGNLTTPEASKTPLEIEIEKLKAQEAAKAAAKVPALPHGFAEAVAYIESAGMGVPAMTHDAMKAWAQHKGLDIAGQHGLAGSGKVAEVTISKAEQVITIAGEIQALKAAAGEPAVAAPPPAATEPQALGLLSPDTPVSDPLAASTPPAAVAPVVTPPTCAKRETIVTPPPEVTVPAKPGPLYPYKGIKAAQIREMLRDAEASIDALANAAPVGVLPGPPVETPAAKPTTTVYVDCVPNTQSQPLEPYVDRLRKRIRDEYTAADIRTAPKDTPLGYGQWRGVLAAIIREVPPGPGVYTYRAKGDELSEVVADALRTVVDTIVRG